MRRALFRAGVSLSLLALFAFVNAALADPIGARHKQGSSHAFVTLLGEEGRTLAVGEVLETVHGSRVTSRLTFRFRDGSTDDDTTIFDQSRDLHVLSDHHVQQGPSFPHPLDIRIDVPAAQVTVHDFKSGKDTTEHLDFPADVVNGIIPQLIQNISSRTAPTTVSYVAAGSKPRIVKLVVSAVGDDIFSIAGTHHRARKYEIKVDLGGITALVAPVIGKQPKSSYVWVVGGQVPAFLKMQAQLYEGGPVWTIQQASPVWSAQAAK